MLGDAGRGDLAVWVPFLVLKCCFAAFPDSAYLQRREFPVEVEPYSFFQSSCFSLRVHVPK